MSMLKMSFTTADANVRVMDAEEWKNAIQAIEFVFQPIANTLTSSYIGYEALLRGYERAGFKSIDAVFDSAHAQDMLMKVTLLLLDKKLEAYVSSGCFSYAKLFVNVDSRILPQTRYFMSAMDEMLTNRQIPKSSIVVEISERFEISHELDSTVFHEIKNGGVGIALDDYGANFSGLRLLYHSEPHYIKVDRFFISGIHHDIKKRIFLSSLVSKAHMLGMLIIAEGVETCEEFYLCKELGCDMVQGYLIQRPGRIAPGMNRRSPSVEGLNTSDKRTYGSDGRLITSLMNHISPVMLANADLGAASVDSIFNTFRENKYLNFIPVINEAGEPAGIILERDIKEFVYSQYGHSLLKHKGVDIKQFVTRSPVFEITSNVEKILEGFSMNKDAEGVLITKNGKYAGLLYAKSLLRMLYEKNVSTARDQNPLSKLPGNNIIHDYLSKAIKSTDYSHIISYFDFNNFKPFNDTHGFRKGDKAILLFADLLRELAAEGVFVGHIGGDDFFAGFRDDAECFANAFDKIKGVIAQFAEQAAELYTQDEREKGCITSVDREGKLKLFPLLTVSAAVLNVPIGARIYSMEDIGAILADVKKSAKHAETHMAWVSLGTGVGNHDVIGTKDASRMAGASHNGAAAVE